MATKHQVALAACWRLNIYVKKLYNVIKIQNVGLKSSGGVSPKTEISVGFWGRPLPTGGTQYRLQM